MCAQQFYPHQLTVGIGSAAPGSQVNMDSGVALELNYGRRFTRFIQFDAGFESSFNKDYRNYYPKYETGLTTNTSFFVPVGGRILIPLMQGRIEPSFGVGGVYAWDKNNPYHQNQGGVYGLLGGSYALDPRHKHRVGATLRYMNMMSSGRPHPRWLNIFGEYSYSWGE